MCSDNQCVTDADWKTTHGMCRAASRLREETLVTQGKTREATMGDLQAIVTVTVTVAYDTPMTKHTLHANAFRCK